MSNQNSLDSLASGLMLYCLFLVKYKYYSWQLSFFLILCIDVLLRKTQNDWLELLEDAEIAYARPCGSCLVLEHFFLDERHIEWLYLYLYFSTFYLKRM